MDHWYVLHTKPRNEKYVAVTLEQRGIQVYFPEQTHKNARGQIRKKAFFPGYLFASLDLAILSPALWKWVPGLRYVVAHGDQPIPVPDEVIKLIAHNLLEAEQSASTLQLQFEPGDVVRIKDGPFEDMLAIFEGPTKPSVRVQVLLNTLNRAVRVSLQVNDLEKATTDNVEPIAKRPRRTRGRGRPIS